MLNETTSSIHNLINYMLRGRLYHESKFI